MRLPTGPWVGAPGGLSSGNRKKNLAGGRGIQSWPWVEEPFPPLSTRGHLCSVLQEGLQGPRHRGRPRVSLLEEWAGKEALECSWLRQPGLRHRAGQQHPCAMGLECGQGWAYPWPLPHGNGACLEPLQMESAPSPGVSRPGF